MKKLVLGLLSAAAVVGLSTGDAAAGGNSYYSYAVKFVCGKAYDAEYQIVDGLYATAINVYNPYEHKSIYEWRVWLAYGDHPGGDYGYHPGEVHGFDGYNITCDDLYYDWHFSGYDYIKGVLHITSTKPLDVIAVYTAGYGDGEQSIDVEYVPGRKSNRDEKKY
jgi:hypothetical protein